MSMIGSVTPDMIASDARAFFDFLRSRPEVSGDAFGVSGYCMGGRTSLIVAGRVPDRVAAAASFHGGGLVTDDPDSPHLLADRMRATVYVGGAENDASFTAEHAETLDKALTAAGVEHTVEFYPAGARVRGARQRALRQGGRRAALGRDGEAVRGLAALIWTGPAVGLMAAVRDDIRVDNLVSTTHDDADVGSRINPVLARSWLLVNGAQYERFAPAVRSRADIVVLDIEDAVAPKDKVAARSNVLKWLGEDNSDWVRVNGFGTQWWQDDLDMLSGTSVGGVMLAMVESVDHVTETAKRLPERSDRRTRRDGARPRTDHRDRGGEGHIPARLRYRRLPPGHRFRRQPDHPGLRALAIHDRREGRPPTERHRRPDRRIQRLEAERGHSGFRRVRHDRQDLPDAGSVRNGERGAFAVLGRNQLGQRVFRSSSSATAARSATAQTCPVSPVRTRSSIWRGRTESSRPSSTMSTTPRTSQPRRTPTTTESAAGPRRDLSCAGNWLSRALYRGPHRWR